MSRSKLAAILSCTTLALGAAACGDDEGGGGANAVSDPAGAFAQTCGGCHTLAAAKTGGQTGPNLDELKPDQATVQRAIEQGPSVMPSGLFEGPDAEAVAKYVADNAGS